MELAGSLSGEYRVVPSGAQVPRGSAPAPRAGGGGAPTVSLDRIPGHPFPQARVAQDPTPTLPGSRL